MDRSSLFRRLTAVLYAALCHGLFAVSVGLMAFSIYYGFEVSLSPLTAHLSPPWKIAVDLALLLQFPLLHSFLLSKPGKRYLEALAPAPYNKSLATTIFVAVSAAQLLILFAFWSPSGIILASPRGILRTILIICYVASWLALGKAMWDADIRVQTGTLGWRALARNERPSFKRFSEKGMYALCRHPIYLSFLGILWFAPEWTVDRLILVPLWSAYLYMAPKRKEQRYLAIYGDAYREYMERVPYMFPLPRMFRGKEALSLGFRCPSQCERQHNHRTN